MKVDDCAYTFEELAASVLPGHMRQLRDRLAHPWQAARFAEPGRGPQAIAREFGREADFKGCYVFLQRTQPIYVGISRTVLARVRQHLLGTTHFDASLAYLMAQRRVPNRGSRDQAMADPSFLDAFAAEQQSLRACSVAAVNIENAVERYMFEVYAAMELGTGDWNTLETH